jgi:hypothetical protein
MSNIFSGQMPIMLDIGGKIGRHWFLGGYVGLGLGGTAGDFATLCSDASATCVAISFRIGTIVEYNFLPSGRVNPWLGFGAGMEYNTVSMSGSNGSGSITGIGVEIAQLLAGVDFRLSRGFGIGPYIAFSVGTYVKLSVDDNGTVTDAPIDTPGWHGWVTIGARMTFFP